ncbi:MAG: hypothetical protein KAT79_02345, partial [candidate division Zixibacteria bacterium]|nr:hypothetical protein [candidate division Zixibacteria bacterium]
NDKEAIRYERYGQGCACIHLETSVSYSRCEFIILFLPVNDQLKDQTGWKTKQEDICGWYAT